MAEDLPKSFLLTEEYGMQRVYLTQFNTATLERRLTQQTAGSDSMKGSKPNAR